MEQLTTTEIPTADLYPHPDNPRLLLRQDVIDGIASQLDATGHFDAAHALLVRRVDDHYQIIRGHHRWMAAQQAGLETVPCWVREMSDDDAYMQLALGNVQGELSPLEIGVHALKATDKGKHNGYNRAAYADMIGKTQATIAQVTSAAEVLLTLENLSQLNFLDKAQHLYEIHKAPRELWPMLAQWLVDGFKSVSQTQEMVKQIRKFDISYKWRDIFLPLKDIVQIYIEDGTFTPDKVAALVNSAELTERVISGLEESLGDRITYNVNGFMEWLRKGVGSYAWDVTEIDGYRQAAIARARDAQKPPKPDAQLGRWYQLGRHLLYCGDTGAPAFWESAPQVAFAFADPPYNANVAEWDSGFEWRHDWLIARAPIVAVTPGIESIQDFYRITEMPHAWAMSAHITNGMTRGKLGFGNWIFVALFAQEDTDLHRQAQDVLQVSISIGDTIQSSHRGRKPPELMRKLIALFTEPEQVIIDPFLGSGTTLFVADELNRVCIGGEINPQFCNEIIERWQTQTGQGAEVVQNETD